MIFEALAGNGAAKPGAEAVGGGLAGAEGDGRNDGQRAAIGHEKSPSTGQIPRHRPMRFTGSIFGRAEGLPRRRQTVT